MLLLWGPIKAPLKINCAPQRGRGTSLREANIGCAAVWGLIFPPELTKMGSIIGHRIDYNGVGAPRGQWHIPSKNLPKYFPPPELCHANLLYKKWKWHTLLCFML